MGNKNKIDEIKIPAELSIKECLKKIDQGARKILYICDKNGCLLGSLTDGDIRRRLLETGNLQEEIVHCFNRNPIFVTENNYTIEEIKKLMLGHMIEGLPILDENKKIIDILFWVDVFGEGSKTYRKINIPVVIMAGGKGERLGPFTKILPKCLIPVGERPIIEMIMDRFSQHGVRHFYVSLNYKGEMVQTYFGGTEKKYTIDYIWEKEFFGTAGSLKLLPPDISENFIVSNCDIIVDVDYADLLRFHRRNKNILTVVGSIQHYKVPYGIIHFKKEGKLQEIQEKPEFDFTVNTGVYVLSRQALAYIPEDRHFDMTDFIQTLLNSKENVGVYPVSQKSYIDIGRWEEYKEYTQKLI
ncbi:MAG: nucleotidyltransferase family protein [Candidatus Omnitrophota bacterium]|nr:MAG: nucleotidyltransferase family protein [Candidatus Omnitrophota bacterium]